MRSMVEAGRAGGGVASRPEASLRPAGADGARIAPFLTGTVADEIRCTWRVSIGATIIVAGSREASGIIDGADECARGSRGFTPSAVSAARTSAALQTDHGGVNGSRTSTTRQVAHSLFSGTSMDVCPTTAEGHAYTIDANTPHADLHAIGRGNRVLSAERPIDGDICVDHLN